MCLDLKHRKGCKTPVQPVKIKGPIVLVQYGDFFFTEGMQEYEQRKLRSSGKHAVRLCAYSRG